MYVIEDSIIYLQEELGEQVADTMPPYIHVYKNVVGEGSIFLQLLTLLLL